ncbi:MAG: CPBP family intramembrane metalloprotease [Oscillospiraceae bacterium]|nr:CPBP family intramembrane metalloprotease [Oscillospiraceae bacterium]
MARKAAATTSMNHTERLAGTIFFVVYLLVMPLLADRLFALFEVLLDTRIDAGLQNALYYYILFAVTLVIFHGYIGATTTKFFDSLNRSLGTLFLSLLVFYGANELMYRIANLFFHSRTNLNDTTIAAQVSAAPRTTALIVVFLAPFVEEVLFRGLVFGCVKEKSRVVAYAVSSLLFAFLHVWTFALSAWDLSYLTLMAQYLVPGLVFAWAYDRSGTLWTSILLHAVVNALALFVILT